MSNLSIEVIVSPGADIQHACNEACALATRMLVAVKFDFNSVICTARPGGDPDNLAANWKTALDSKSQYKFASCRP